MISPRKWYLIWSALLIVFSVGVYGGFFANLYTHEAVHKEIYRNYGLHSDIRLNYFTLSGYTTAEVPEGQKYKEFCNEYCELAHDITESIGYQLDGLVINLWLILFVFFLFELFFKDLLKRRIKWD